MKPPRIKITYDLEINGALVAKELPVVLGMIGDYSGMRDTNKEFSLYKDRKFIYVDPENFDEALKSMRPRLLITAPSMDGKETKTLEINFEELKDFEPLNLIKKIDFLYELYEEKRKLNDLRMKKDLNHKVGDFLNEIITDGTFKDTIKTQATAGDGKELNDMIESTHFCHNPEQKPYACELILNYINIIEKNTDTTLNSFDLLDRSSITYIDNALTYYLQIILQDKGFQKLEGSWRGVLYFLKNAEFNGNLKLRILNASVEELFTDLTKAMEFDQSVLFKKVYEEEYGTFGGAPYTSMMWDYSLGRTSQDMILLRKMTEVMAAAHCPLFLGAAAALFDLKSFELLHQPYSISKIFDSLELSEFRTFRESPDAKYVTLLLPRIIARLPYNTHLSPIEGVNFVEEVSGLVAEEYTWMNPAYAYLTQVSLSYTATGWFASICGVENGGKVDNLPLHIFKTITGEYNAKCPTEVAITDRREKELSDLGFLALCNCKDENFSVFFGSNSSYKPPLFTNDNANANGELSTRTPYMLNVSRFAHYLKCIMRDKIGSFSSKNDVASFLSEWLCKYTLLDDKAPQARKLKYPLREFSVQIDDVVGKPGYYTSVILLRPHDELQGLEISLRLVANTNK